MNGRLAKKVRKYSKRNWMEYVNAIQQWPWTVRLRFCWHILFGMRTRPRKLSKKEVLANRRPVPKGA